MAKANVKVVEKTVNLPAGEKIARDGGEVVRLDAASIRLVMRGWELKKQLEEIDAQLKQINAELIEAHGTDCSLVVTGVCRASIAEREAVRIKDAERLKAVLGFRFTDLVKTEIAYKPEGRLVEMAADGDEPLAPSVRECLTVGKSCSVTWRAEK
ncbi:MAG: hypothetical protein Fur0039_15470 [Rhodocyclaceae bacterium]